ncbi:MAG: InlB B-repeat-containing protein [Candidatus Riflebacteria bacterium]|nr:InlB B-repeat-containing protein [Candidatus Riflebacteria bacterium]
MSKRLLFLIISVAAIAAFLGCGGGGPQINTFDTQIVERSAETKDNGKFADISFPSGAIIRCSTSNAFQEGVKITAVEEKIFVEYDYAAQAPVYYYLYKISAVLPSSNSLEGDASVSTIEQPLSITLPNNISDSGTCFLGSRADKNDPWRYTLIEDSPNAKITSSRLAQRAGKTCTFNIFRLGYEFRLFVFDSFKENEAVVTGGTTSTENKLSTKDGKYLEDLNLKVKLSGEKLNLLKPDCLTARITYRNGNLTPVQLKANGSIVQQTDSSDKAISSGFAHYFEVSDINFDSQMSGEALLSLVLNLKNISLTDFPTSFLIEFYSKNGAEGTLPFIYAQTFDIETEEQQPQSDTYVITLDPKGGTLEKTTIEYTANDSFNLPTPTKTGYTFLGWTGDNGDTPQTTVPIDKGSTGNRNYKANWKQNAPDEYTLTLNIGTGIASVDESKAYKANESISLNYTLKDGYQFDKWSDSEGNKVESPFTMPAKDVALTANAKVIKYNLTYNDIENCTFETANPASYNVESEDFTLNNPQKDGHTFTGWTGSNGNTAQTSVTIAKGSTGDRTYTANWSKNS